MKRKSIMKGLVAHEEDQHHKEQHTQGVLPFCGHTHPGRGRTGTQTLAHVLSPLNDKHPADG